MFATFVPLAMLELPALFQMWISGLADTMALSPYDLSWADLAAVTAYFVTMAVLSVYGFHRYQLIYLYYKRRPKVGEAPARYFENLPSVTVQLPIYNEQYVVEQLIETVCRLDYPRHLLQIQVLDDSTDETCFVARAASKRFAALGYPIEYLHRDHRRGYKAGALQAGLKQARGELIAVFDADFSPTPDFLRRTIHYFTDPQVGMVQARWSYRNRDQSLLTQVQAVLLDGHFVFEHGGRSRSGRFFNFNGTAGVLRRATIEDAGGWQHDTLTEDTDLSYRAQLKGWKFLYLPHVEVPSELPVEMASFQTQQARWAKGLIQTAKKILPRLLRSDLPWPVKMEACFHLTANLSYPLVVLLSVLLLPSLIVRFYVFDGYLLLLDLPLFLGTFSSLTTFYLLSQKELFPRQWRRKLLLVPAIVAVGIGLTITNTKAVLEALLGIESPFERTAKYSTDRRRAHLAHLKYRPTCGWLPVANLVIGCYFAGCFVYCALIGNWPTMPFLALFVTGYFLTGGWMLQQSSDGLLETRGRRLTVREKTVPGNVTPMWGASEGRLRAAATELWLRAAK